MRQKNPEIGYHYASALAKDGKRSEAAQILGKALQSKTPFTQREDAELLAKQLQ